MSQGTKEYMSQASQCCHWWLSAYSGRSCWEPSWESEASLVTGIAERKLEVRWRVQAAAPKRCGRGQTGVPTVMVKARWGK